MKIDLLREYIVLAQNLNYSTAAKQLFISQPGLSKHMRDLEKEVGCKLINGSPSVSLTPAGQSFLESAEELVFTYDAALKKCRAIEKSSPLSLTVHSPIALDETSNAFIEAYRRFAKEHPYSSIRMTATKNDSLFEALKKQRVDVGIYRSFEQDLSSLIISDDEEYHLVPLGKESASVRMMPSCPLATKEQLVPQDLEGVPILVPGGKTFESERKTIESFFSRYDVTPRCSLRPVSTIEDFALRDLENGVFLLSSKISDSIGLIDGLPDII